MTASETPDELRARLGGLFDAAKDGWDIYSAVLVTGTPNGALIVALVNAWPAIDALLARLTAAEADADRLRRRSESAEEALRFLQRLSDELRSALRKRQS